MELTKPTIVRLCRQAGIKSVSDECYPYIRAVLIQRLKKITQTILVVNDEHQTKTITSNDVYEALRFLGENVAICSELSDKTVGK